MAAPFRESLARVARNGKWGHINKSGEFVIEPRFEMAYEFDEGLAPVTLNMRTGYVSRSGELVIPPVFLWGRRFSEGLAAVDVGTGKVHTSSASLCEVGFIKPSGEFAIRPSFLYVGTFQGGICLVENETSIGYIDRGGTFRWKSRWVELGDFDPLHLFPAER
jgi:hypothetical protein